MTIVSAVFIGLIFLNSIQTGPASSEQSGKIVLFLQSIFDQAGITVTVSTLFVRKAAHFIEFAVLGVLLGATLKSYTKKMRQYLQSIFAPLFIGLCTAVADEYIQLHVAGRAGMVQDIVLDFAGFLTGLGLTVLVILFKGNIKSKNSR